jgi:hypothetical protein
MWLPAARAAATISSAIGPDGVERAGEIGLHQQVMRSERRAVGLEEDFCRGRETREPRLLALE